MVAICLMPRASRLLSKFLLGKNLDAVELFAGAQEVTAALRSDFWLTVLYICGFSGSDARVYRPLPGESLPKA